jgi:hypothetical protein
MLVGLTRLVVSRQAGGIGRTRLTGGRAGEKVRREGTTGAKAHGAKAHGAKAHGAKAHGAKAHGAAGRCGW